MSAPAASRNASAAALALLLLVATAPAAPLTHAPVSTTRPAVRRTPSRAAAPHAAAPRAAAAHAIAAADSTGHAHGRVGPRTLDDIHIEGEIPVPQVLFITARDQRRFMEFQHHRYTRTSLELGRSTAMPSRVVVPEPGPVVGKENER